MRLLTRYMRYSTVRPIVHPVDHPTAAAIVPLPPRHSGLLLPVREPTVSRNPCSVRPAARATRADASTRPERRHV